MTEIDTWRHWINPTEGVRERENKRGQESKREEGKNVKTQTMAEKEMSDLNKFGNYYSH